MAARTIDPATGASTCALGSHRWTENSGSFVINAAVHNSAPKEEFKDSGMLIMLVGIYRDLELA